MKHKLETTEWGIIPVKNHRGCLVTKVYGVGYTILGQTVDSLDKLDMVIDNAGDAIQKSILFDYSNED